MNPRDVESLKRRSAEAAAARVESGMVVGLGTGSTVAHLLDILAAALRDGSLTDIVGIPTSVRTETRAGELGIPLVGLADRPAIDVTIDGADEISPELELIKGGGGALLREKMVAQASRRLVIIADEGKRVARLGTSHVLPVEVLRWEWRAHLPFLEELGAEPTLRTGTDGEPLVSDNGHYIVDCGFRTGIADPASLDRALSSRAGVVESGLFLGLASEAFVAGADGVTHMERPR